MSSMDEATLEYFIEDSFRSLGRNDPRFVALVALLEPERETIEYKMAFDFSEDEHNWRDYRNGMWYTLEAAYGEAIRKITEE